MSTHYKRTMLKKQHNLQQHPLGPDKKNELLLFNSV